MNHKLLVTILFFPLLFSEHCHSQSQITSDQNPISAAQCATFYNQITQDLNHCLSSLNVNIKRPKILIYLFDHHPPNDDSCKKVLLGNPDKDADLADLAAYAYGPCMEQVDEMSNRYDSDQSFRDEVNTYFQNNLFPFCQREAAEKFATVSKPCAASAPFLFSSSCIWSQTIASACHANCSGASCGACSPYDLQLKLSCNTKVTTPVRAAPGFTPLCQDALNSGSECRKGCLQQSGVDIASCTANCNASTKTSWNACWLAMGMTPPPLEVLPTAGGLPSSRNGQKANSDRKARTSSAGVNSKGLKPLPPSPCRSGQRCGTSSSTGVATNANKPKINLDQHDLEPSFVNASPNAGRIGNRPGGGGGSAAKPSWAPLKTSPMDGISR